MQTKLPPTKPHIRTLATAHFRLDKIKRFTRIVEGAQTSKEGGRRSGVNEKLP